MGQLAFQSWQPVSVTELEAYMGFMILMGVVHLPALFDYWKNDPLFHYSPVASRIQEGDLWNSQNISILLTTAR